MRSMIVTVWAGIAVTGAVFGPAARAQTPAPAAAPADKFHPFPAGKWQPPSERPFPILAYGSPLAIVTTQPKPKGTEIDADYSLLTEEGGKRMVEAGFNLAVLLNTRTPEAIRDVLAFCQKAGIGLVLYDDRLLGNDANATKAAVAEWSKASALAAYFVIDEPGPTSDFEKLGARRELLAKLDPDHWAYANLLPTYGMQVEIYQDYLARFIKAFRPAVLSYDHYCISRLGINRDYYQNLEFTRSAAMEANIPFWAFARVTPMYGWPVPTEGHLRFQLYSSLAYGAKGLEYYRYFQHGHWSATAIGLVDAKGEKTAPYEPAKKINWEIQHMGKLLLSLESTAVFHSDPYPRGVTPFKSYGGLIDCVGAPAVLGFFKAPNGDTYLMVVNRDHQRAGDMELSFSKSVPSIEEVDRDTMDGGLKPVRMKTEPYKTRNVCDLRLAPGDGRLFRINSER